MRRHRRLTLLGLVASLVVLAGLAQAAGAPTPALPGSAPRVVLQESFPPPIRLDLTRLSPTTLAPIGPTQREPAGYWPDSVSPDQRRVLLVKVARSTHPVAAVRIVALPSLHAGRPISLGSGPLTDAAWTSATRLVVLAQSARASFPYCCDARIAQIDAAGGTAAPAQPALQNASIVVDAAYRDGFVIVAAPPVGSGIGPAQLVIASASAPPRVIPLDRIQAGLAQSDVTTGFEIDEAPGLALDAADAVAYVVGGDGLVARVDLASGAVTYQQPAGASAPPASLQDVTAHVRISQWIGGGRILVSGYDEDASGNGLTLQPVGTSIIDSASWSEAALDPSDDSVAVDGSIVFSYRTLVPAGAGGLHAFASDGSPLYSALQGRHVRIVQPLGPRLVVYTGKQHLVRWLLDAKSGRVLGHRASGNKTFSLLVGSSLLAG
jgi:hypothetical protein